MFAIHTYEGVNVSKIYKNFLKLKNMKTNSQIEKLIEDMNRHLIKDIHMVNNMKIFSTSFALEKCK